jgi:hypothetical protein
MVSKADNKRASPLHFLSVASKIEASCEKNISVTPPATMAKKKDVKHDMSTYHICFSAHSAGTCERKNQTGNRFAK